MLHVPILRFLDLIYYLCQTSFCCCCSSFYLSQD